ncbi:MAG: hypothetical protein ACFCVA_12530 [Gammaproteobacteria bacterium]
MKFLSSAMYGQPPVAALNQSAPTGANRAGTEACPYGGKYDPAIHHRHSIRLQGYDYSQAGAYFVTVCTQKRECLFGEIVNGNMRLNDAGRMVQAVWDEIPAHYPDIDIDAFIVMPNHIHGIVVIVWAAPCDRPNDGNGLAQGPNGLAQGPNGQAQGPAPTEIREPIAEYGVEAWMV